MTTTTHLRPIRLVRPLHERLLADGLHALRLWLQRRAERRRRAREFQAVSDMNEALLRDIGAPDWMIDQAQAKREADFQRLMELNMGLPRHE